MINRLLMAISLYAFMHPCGWSADTINLRLKGNITEQSCAISSGSENFTVELGEWDLRPLQGGAGKTTPERDFSISLTNCPPGPVSVKFTGKQVVGNPDLLAAGGGKDDAKNIAIQLMNSDKSVLSLNTKSSPVTVKEDGAAVLKFYARYITLSSAVTAGEASSQANFTVVYQ